MGIENRVVKSVLEDIVRILDKQTIKGVQEECKRIVNNKGLSDFESFVDEGPHFISTSKRETILEEITEGLKEREAPCVIIHGAYGSGKSIMMYIIEKLCEKDKKIGGKEFTQIRYGSTELDCFSISLEESPVPIDFLYNIYKSFVEGSNKISEKDLIEIFNERKTNLTLEDLSQDLSKKQKSKYLEIFDNPTSLRDISKVVKSLPAGEVCLTIEWFASHYRDVENKYPAIYIDEFEQMIRQVEPGETTRLKLIVQRMIRSSATGFDKYDRPPYILFANTLALDELTEKFQAERDLVDRIRESISHNMDLSPVETKELFKELYRLYLLPLLNERKNAAEIEEWRDRIKKSEFNEDDYTYPFTNEALDFVLQKVVEIVEEEEVIRAFRDYKNILVAYLALWDGDSRIDLDYLYKKGDEVREYIGELERADIKNLPGKHRIEDTIDSTYNDINEILRRVMKRLAKSGILNYSESPVYFNISKIEEEAEEVEISLSKSEITNFINEAVTQDYFEEENERLVFYPDKLISESSVEGPKTKAKLVQETVEKLNLENKPLINLWQEAIENELNPKLAKKVEKNNNQYLIFDVENEFYYSKNIYISISSLGKIPARLQDKIDSKALHMVINFQKAAQESDAFVEYHVFERNNRASNFVENIKTKLNQQIFEQMKDEANTQLMEIISDSFQDISDFRMYTLFLKLSLAKLAGYEIDSDLTPMLAKKRTLSILDIVDRELRSGKPYVRKKLGLKHKYKGKDLMDFIYGVKYHSKEETLLFDNPSIPEIDVKSFGGVQQSNRAGEAFKNEVLEKFSDELFLEKSSENEFNLVPDFSTRTAEVIEKIEEKIKDEEELKFKQIFKLLFGTSNIENIGKAMVYLILVLGDYWDKWVIKDIEEKVVKSDVVLESRKKELKENAKKTIKKAIIENVVQNNDDIAHIEELKQKYNKINDIQNKSKLDSLENSFNQKMEINHGKVEEKLKEIISKDVFADTEIADYVNTIRPISERPPSFLYLIISDLEELADHIIKVGEVQELKLELKQKREKLSKLREEDLDSIENNYDFLTEIKQFMENNNLEKNISYANVNQEIDDYIKGRLGLKDLYESLNEIQDSIAPNFEKEDEKIKEAKEELNEKLEKIKEKFEMTIDERKEKIDRKKNELDSLKKKLPNENYSWIRRGENHLDSCEDELKKPITRFSYENYKEYLDEWKKAKQNIEEETIDKDILREKLNELKTNVNEEDVLNANENLKDLLVEIPDDQFNKIIEILDESSEASKKFSCNLIKFRLSSMEDLR